jgi:hypothetical protein
MYDIGKRIMAYFARDEVELVSQVEGIAKGRRVQNRTSRSHSYRHHTSLYIYGSLVACCWSITCPVPNLSGTNTRRLQPRTAPS